MAAALPAVGDEFVVGAVAPEAQVDPHGFAGACRRAEARLAHFREGDPMTALAKFKTGDQLAVDDAVDHEVAAELDRTAVANQLAILVIGYRVEHGLTQTALARTLGVSQPAVARLESGDHEPTVATLARLAHKLRISLRLDVDPESVILSPAS